MKLNKSVLAWCNNQNSIVVFQLKTKKIIQLNIVCSAIWKLLDLSITPKRIYQILKSAGKKNNTITEAISFMKNEQLIIGQVASSRADNLPEVVNDNSQKGMSIGAFFSQMKHKYRYHCHFEITNRCNFKCKHCYLKGLKTEEMTTQSILNCLNELKEEGALELSISGGEPTIRNDLNTILINARKLGFFVTLFTNLSLLKEETIDLIDKYNIKVRASVYGMSNYTYRVFTNKACLSTVLKNLSILKRRNIDTAVVFILSKLSKVELEIAKLKYSSKPFMFKVIDSFTPSLKGNMKPVKQQVAQESKFNLHQIRDMDKKKYTPNKPVCAAGTRIIIKPNGDVWGCTTYQKTLGNILQQPINSIFNSELYEEYIESILFDKFSECVSCKYLDYCQICPGDNLSITGSAYLSSDYCKMKAYGHLVLKHNNERRIK